MRAVVKTLEYEITIEPSRTEEQTDEIRELALSTGMEEDEIDVMISDDKVFLAKKEGNTAGFIALRRTKKEEHLEISGLALNENVRRGGFASLLLKRAEKYADEHKVQRLIVRTSNDNVPALGLYQKNGFTIREVKLGAMIEHHGGKEIPGWEGIPVRDEIVLEKKLRS
jgi:ribosomal protein S18 acetylase RimI-like enzyme